MSEMQHLEISDNQREVLLRGLRFVRSSIMLTPEDPTEESVERKARQLEEVHELIAALSSKSRAHASAGA